MPAPHRYPVAAHPAQADAASLAPAASAQIADRATAAPAPTVRWAAATGDARSRRVSGQAASSCFIIHMLSGLAFVPGFCYAGAGQRLPLRCSTGILFYFVSPGRRQCPPARTMTDDIAD